MTLMPFTVIFVVFLLLDDALYYLPEALFGLNTLKEYRDFERLAVGVSTEYRQ